MINVHFTHLPSCYGGTSVSSTPQCKKTLSHSYPVWEADEIQTLVLSTRLKRQLSNSLDSTLKMCQIFKTLPAAKNITPAHYSAASPSHWRVFLADCPSVLSNTNSLGLAFNSSLKVKQQAGSTALKCIQNFQVMGQHLKNTFIPWQEPTPLLVHNKGGITGTQEQHRLSTCQLWANKASPPAWEQHPEQQHPEQHQGPLQGQQEPVSRSCRKPAMSKVCPAIETPND